MIGLMNDLKLCLNLIDVNSTCLFQMTNIDW